MLRGQIYLVMFVEENFQRYWYFVPFFPKCESFSGWGDGLPVSALFLPRGATFPPPPPSSYESYYYELDDGRNQIFHHSTVILTLVLFIILPAPILATGESVPPKPVTTEVPTVHLKITMYFLCLCSDIFPAIPAEDLLGAQGIEGVAGILSPISSQPASLHMITSGLKMFKGMYTSQML